jgi:protein-tyrosine phosphatase
MIAFSIYSLLAGGGTLALSPMPGRTRHYGTDWQHLLTWKPNLVLTMTTQAELDRKGAGTLGADLTNAGIAWLHLPVADFGVPVGLDWGRVREDVLATLARDGRVLVHCFGGCGRSGMMALRVMIAAGEEPDTALARLRCIRPCSIETDAQMAWATQDVTPP